MRGTTSAREKVSAVIFALFVIAGFISGILLIGLDTDNTPIKYAVVIFLVWLVCLVVCKIMMFPNSVFRHVFACACVVASFFQFIFHTNNRILRRIREVDFNCTNLSEFYSRSLHMYDVAACLDPDPCASSDGNHPDKSLVTEWAQFCLRNRNSRKV